jgi:hypothetical protein
MKKEKPELVAVPLDEVNLPQYKDPDNKVADLLANVKRPDEAETTRNLYRYDREQENLFSRWYSHIKDCGIRVPQSMIFRVPPDVMCALYEPSIDKANETLIKKWVDKTFSFMRPGQYYFCKNGCFSNKFEFVESCIADADSIHESFVKINYASACLDTGGMSEFVLREVVPTARYKKAIYGGMPLRPEFRVFYDFTFQKTLYAANYWDYHAVADNIHDEKDRVVFDETRDMLETMFAIHAGEILELVGDKMRHVHGLHGIWSVDIMLDDLDVPWLIDMALGHRSTYWDPKKAKEAGGII